MSYANLLNYKGELSVPGVNTNKVDTSTITLRDTGGDSILNSVIIKNLTQRIVELETYIEAFQTTYIITRADGTPVQWQPTPLPS